MRTCKVSAAFSYYFNHIVLISCTVLLITTVKNQQNIALTNNSPNYFAVKVFYPFSLLCFFIKPYDIVYFRLS
jgi:hypothetical protein